MMTLEKAKQEIRQLISDFELWPEDLVFTRIGNSWFILTDTEGKEVGESEALDYISSVFQADYIIVNDRDGLMELKFDVSEEEKLMMKAIYLARGLVEDYKDMVKSVVDEIENPEEKLAVKHAILGIFAETILN